jgi:hypothetical protein
MVRSSQRNKVNFGSVGTSEYCSVYELASESCVNLPMDEVTPALGATEEEKRD